MSKTAKILSVVLVLAVVVLAGVFFGVNGEWLAGRIQRGVGGGGVTSGEVSKTVRGDYIMRSAFARLIVDSGSIVVTSDCIGVGSFKFPDVTDPLQNKYICTAYKKGFFAGYSNGNFGPNDLVTRAQGAKVFAQLWESVLNKQIKFKDMSKSAVKSPFKDLFPEDWSFNYVYWGVNKGILTVGADGYFYPGDNLSNSDAVKWADNFKAQVMKEI